MDKKPSQNSTNAQNPEINTTGTYSFEDVPADVVLTILPFLELKDMGKLSLVDKRFNAIIIEAFTKPNMYTAYPGMFEALCKFWHENRVAFQKWFKLYRMPNIEEGELSSDTRNEACDYIFNELQLPYVSVDRKTLNNALKMVFQNNSDDPTTFLLPLVSNTNQFDLYRTFGNTTLQETLETQIATWNTTTATSKENIHTLLFCLLFSRDVKFFIGKHQVLNHMLDYAEKNMNAIFGQDTIKKHGESFIKALLQSCHLTLDAANGTKPTTENINAIRKVFPNVPINFAGAYLREAVLTSADLWEADLTGAHLESANLESANLTGANLTGAKLSDANLTNADLTGADLTGAHSRHAYLIGADLTGANLTGADLKGANLKGANLIDANFTRANLTSANLRCANLTGADLRGVNLTSANLRCANLTGADLRGVNLEGARLWDANLTNANLFRANLTGANLWDANLTCANLTRANLWIANLTGANLRAANLSDANLTGADLTRANLFNCKLSTDTKLDNLKINSSALLSVLKDPNITKTNIWSLNDKMINTFKLLLPHAYIKELEVLMDDVKTRISVHPFDFIAGQLKKAKILKLISDEIAKKQPQKQEEIKEPPRKDLITATAKPSNTNAQAVTHTDTTDQDLYQDQQFNP